jgi:endoglucanase
MHCGTGVLCVLPLCLFARAAYADDSQIRVSSIGYLPERAKHASVLATASEFDVKRKSDGAVAMHGVLAGPVVDPDTGEMLMTADFTAVTEPGDYYVEVAGIGKSTAFTIEIGRAHV